MPLSTMLPKWGHNTWTALKAATTGGSAYSPFKHSEKRNERTSSFPLHAGDFDSLSRIRAVISRTWNPESDIVLWFVMHYTSAGSCFCHVADVTQCLCFWGAFLELLSMTQQSRDCRGGPVCKRVRKFGLYSRLSLEMMTLSVTGKSCNTSHDAFSLFALAF